MDLEIQLTKEFNKQFEQMKKEMKSQQEQLFLMQAETTSLATNKQKIDGGGDSATVRRAVAGLSQQYYSLAS